MAYTGIQRRERVQRFIPPSPTSAYSVKIAECDEDVRQAQRLRFEVFNMELGEGLSESVATGLDRDDFDAVCDHLLVEHTNTGRIIGTYRLQTGETAAAGIGYYSEQEFDFSVFEPIRGEIVELGRACIARDHRNMVVLGLLWKGIANYAKVLGGRYMVGCSSLTSTDPIEGQAIFRKLQGHFIEDPFWTNATAKYDCSVFGREGEIEAAMGRVEIPKLMQAYLNLGARICSEPALDREFKTIDFLTLLDFHSLGTRAMLKFLGK